MHSQRKFGSMQAITIAIIGLASCAPVASPPSVDDIQQARGLVDRGAILLRKGSLADAEAAFRVAHELDGGAASLDGLGCVALLKGEYEEALGHLVSAHAADPDYHNVFGNLALLYELSGDPDHAHILYRRALEGEPANFRARGNFGASLYDNLDRSQAVSELRKAEIVAEHPLVRENLKRAREEWEK